MSHNPSHVGEADLSLIMPCYNEEEALGYTIPRLLNAFEKAGYRLELVAVDNGSRDSTGEILREFAARKPQVICCRVEQNQGYGHGILSGIPYCTAPWIGTIAADGQVDAEDVVRLYEAAVATRGNVLAKVRRRFRMDGFLRKIISISYNLFVQALWPGLGSIDVNGIPRLMPREALFRMRLKSRDWFLDPEMIIKAHYLGLRILELNVFARMRGAGLSHVRAATCWEFFRNLLALRFSRTWKQELKSTEIEIEPGRPKVIGARG